MTGSFTELAAEEASPPPLPPPVPSRPNDCAQDGCLSADPIRSVCYLSRPVFPSPFPLLIHEITHWLAGWLAGADCFVTRAITHRHALRYYIGWLRSCASGSRLECPAITTTARLRGIRLGKPFRGKFYLKPQTRDYTFYNMRR